ncbi:MAG TPA: NAD(P)H-dependent oxidoreductase [Opitutaceae bacterium]|nr:NAD(P)H-dependent oxidoreductase [Opitutaceae bacterium]HRJ46893.1 NAD(P)H-dependent oxidoreductase [Opitutaceae bacterium]
MSNETWHDLGPAETFKQRGLCEAGVGRLKLAITCKDGVFGAVSNVCNHAGGPLGQGRLDGEYLVCPWHNWKFHRRTGLGQPGNEAAAVPSHEVKVEHGRLLVRAEPASPRKQAPHVPHPLARPVARAGGPIRVAGISTTVMDRANPRYSTSEALLEVALACARDELGCETQLLRLSDLKFGACEGYYSKSAQACTWPCSITQFDPDDELTAVYEAFVHWADVVLVATPIRWGQASSLYFKMAERMNCVQNQITIRDRVLIRHKVAGFIITGGQDNIQGVAGQMLAFFSEIGFHLPQFPFVAHSRGWTAEDMEKNVAEVRQSEELREGARDLARRSATLARMLVDQATDEAKTARGGRKAHRLEVEKAQSDGVRRAIRRGQAVNCKLRVGRPG